MAKKTPGIKNIGPRRWEVRVTRKLPDGRRKDRVLTVEGTKAQAAAERVRLLEGLEREEIEPSPGVTRLTLTAYARLWLPRKVAEGRKRSTIRNYTSALEQHILPALGDRYLDELRPADVSAWMTAAPGAPRSKRARLTLLRQIAQDSCADGYAPMDWTLRVRGPEAPPTYTEDDPNLLTPEQAGQLLRALTAPWRTMVYLIVLTGLRWCELAGLMWADVDLDARVLRVRRGNVRGHLDAPKTRAARRVVPLVDPLPAVLETHRRRLLAAQHPGLPTGLIFTTRWGTPYKDDPLQPALDKACEALQIPRVTPHGLRRTFNNETRKVAQGTVLRAMVGHTTEAMSDHYSLVGIDEKRAAVKAVAELVEGAARKKRP